MKLPFSFVSQPSDANTIGSIAGVASIDWSCAVQVMAAANIGSGGIFEATTGQTLYVALGTENDWQAHGFIHPVVYMLPLFYRTLLSAASELLF